MKGELMNTHGPEKPWQKNYIKRAREHMGIKRL